MIFIPLCFTPSTPTTAEGLLPLKIFGLILENYTVSPQTLHTVETMLRKVYNTHVVHATCTSNRLDAMLSFNSISHHPRTSRRLADADLDPFIMRPRLSLPMRTACPKVSQPQTKLTRDRSIRDGATKDCGDPELRTSAGRCVVKSPVPF